MKKLLLLALLAVMMTGCAERNPDGSIKLDAGADNPHTIIIDSCEYINWGYGLAHKGNCRFCQERRNKELEELIKKIGGEE